jgi:hypothetical protein
MKCRCPSWIPPLTALALVGCTGAGDKLNLGQVHVKSQAVTAAQGGTLTVGPTDVDAAHNSLIGTQVEIPAGALSADTVITIDWIDTSQAANQIIDADSDQAGPAIELGPDGTKFQVPVRITMPFTGSYNEDDVRVFVVSAGNTTVLMPDDVLYADSSKTLLFETPHFTRFQPALARHHCNNVVGCPLHQCRHGHCLPAPPPPNACQDSDCGPLPPTVACPLTGNGSAGGGPTPTPTTGPQPICERDSSGKCSWVVPPCPPPPTACDPTQCGPQPGIATYVCADGSQGGPTGQCIRDPNGNCVWEIHQCPPTCGGTPPPNPQPQPTPACTGQGFANANGACTDVNTIKQNAANACAAQKGALTNLTFTQGNCASGSASGASFECCPDPTTTGGSSSGPSTGGSTGGGTSGQPGQIACPPGTTCDPTTGKCEPISGGNCGNVNCGPNEYCCSPTCGICAPVGGACPAIACPPPPPVCGATANGQPTPNCCTPADCGPQPGIPTYTCQDGSVGGFTGQCVPTPPTSASPAKCQWQIIDCPSACTAQECGPEPLQPNHICPDGKTVAGPTGQCTPDPSTGTCGWVIVQCPP